MSEDNVDGSVDPLQFGELFGPDVLPDAGPILESIKQSIDIGKASCEFVEKGICLEIDRCIGLCRIAHGECLDCISGAIGRLIDQARGHFQKVALGLSNAIVSRLAEAAGILVDLGIPFPTVEDITAVRAGEPLPPVRAALEAPQSVTLPGEPQPVIGEAIVFIPRGPRGELPTIPGVEPPFFPKPGEPNLPCDQLLISLWAYFRDYAAELRASNITQAERCCLLVDAWNRVGALLYGPTLAQCAQSNRFEFNLYMGRIWDDIRRMCAAQGVSPINTLDDMLLGLDLPMSCCNLVNFDNPVMCPPPAGPPAPPPVTPPTVIPPGPGLGSPGGTGEIVGPPSPGSGGGEIPGKLETTTPGKLETGYPPGTGTITTTIPPGTGTIITKFPPGECGTIVNVPACPSPAKPDDPQIGSVSVTGQAPPPAGQATVLCSPADMMKAVSVPPGSDAYTGHSFAAFLAKSFAEGFEGAVKSDNSSWLDKLGRNVVKMLLSALFIIPGAMLDVVTTIAGGDVACTNPVFRVLLFLRAKSVMAGNWFGITPPVVSATYDYLLNYSCPYLIPSVDQLNTLYVQNLLTAEEWRAAVSCTGSCPEWQSIVIESNRTIPNVFESTSLYRRQRLDREAWLALLRRNGVKSEADADLFLKLTEQIPGSSDLTRFMTRDAADENVVAEFDYDQEFEEKFTGRIREWAEAQGVSEEYMRFVWRSHWQIPSNTAFYEMLARLRPGRPETGDGYDDVIVTPEQVQQALKINDMAPKWVRALMAIAYQPLTRVDVRRAFELGLIDKEEVYNAYLDLGYSPTNARRLADFTEVDSGPKRSARLGYPSRDAIAKDFATGALSHADAEELLRGAGVREESIPDILRLATVKRSTALKRERIAAVRRQFVQGAYSDTEIAGKLIQAGLDPAKIDGEVEDLRKRRATTRKQPLAAKLCEWLQRRLITYDEYNDRLTRIGYSVEDAASIANVCRAKEQERLQAEIDQAIERARKEAEKLARQREKERREAIRCARQGWPYKDRKKPEAPPGLEPPSECNLNGR